MRNVKQGAGIGVGIVIGIVLALLVLLSSPFWCSFISTLINPTAGH